MSGHALLLIIFPENWYLRAIIQALFLILTMMVTLVPFMRRILSLNAAKVNTRIRTRPHIRCPL